MNICQGLNYANITEENKDLFINSCGMIWDIDVNTGVRRENGREDYQLLCIKKGPFYVSLDNEEVVFGDDTVIIFHPGEPQIYRCNAYEGANYFWVHFSGEKAGELLEKCGLFDKKQFSVIVKDRYFEIIEKSVFEITNKHPAWEIKLVSLFLELLCGIAKSADEGKKEQYKKILPAIKAMEQDTGNGFSISEYAKMCNMSSSRFMHKFKEITGQTVLGYKNEILMRKAGYMLENTDLSITEISQNLGIEDSLYFCKKFKAFFGIAPSRYRKKLYL